MADEMEVVKPVYCTGSNCDNALMAAMMSNGMNGQWNNPFVYLVWMMFANRFFGNGGFGYGGNGNVGAAAATAAGDVNLQAKLNEIAAQISDNQNTNLMMQAINGNHEALHTLSASLGVDYANLNGAISNVQNAITAVGGRVGMTGQEVINAVLLGNKDLTQALQSCCCENKILGLQNTNAIQSQAAQIASQAQMQRSAIASQDQLQRSQIAAGTNANIEGVKNAMINGFSTIGYQNAQHTTDIIQASDRNTQRILDQLNQHWTAELSQELQNAKFETSQLKQNVYLGGLINGTTTGGLW